MRIIIKYYSQWKAFNRCMIRKQSVKSKIENYLYLDIKHKSRFSRTEDICNNVHDK